MLLDPVLWFEFKTAPLEDGGPVVFAPFAKTVEFAEVFSTMLFSTDEFALAAGIFDLRLPMEPETTCETFIMLPLAPPVLCGPGMVSWAVVAEE